MHDHFTDERLRSIWLQALNLESADADANFFDLGGDSIAVLGLLSELEGKLGLKCDLSTIFQHPTLNRLQQYISNRPVAKQENLKFFWRLHDGEQFPFFCFAHAPYMGETRPVLIHPGFYNNIHDFESVLTIDWLEQNIKQMAAEIESVHREGPYYLQGYCHGGWVALAIAQELKCRKRNVAYVGLVETHIPALKDAQRTKGALFYKYLSSSNGALRKVLIYVLEKLSKDKTPAEKRLIHFNNVLTFLRYQESLLIQGYEGKVHLYIRNDTPASDRATVESWRRHVGSDVTLHRIVADHATIRADKLKLVAKIAGDVLTGIENGNIREDPEIN